jgi:hypothetical protein
MEKSGDEKTGILIILENGLLSASYQILSVFVNNTFFTMGHQ